MSRLKSKKVCVFRVIDRKIIGRVGTNSISFITLLSSPTSYTKKSYKPEKSLGFKVNEGWIGLPYTHILGLKDQSVTHS